MWPPVEIMEETAATSVSSMNTIHIDIRTKQRVFYYTRDRQIHQSNTAIVRGPAKNKLIKRHGALLVVGMKQVVATTGTYWY
jgi:hypothetical protein